MSFEGIISHHKTCPGWSSQGDYIPCTHCGARFKQFRSIQTHMERCHNNQFSASASQSSGSWASPPPLPLTPDIVPRAPAPASTSSPPTESGSQPQDHDNDHQEDSREWERRLSNNTNPSSYSVREDELAEKEVRLSELESLVRQAEIKAEQVRKEVELEEWQKELEERERDYQRRLMEATKILNDSRGSPSQSSSFLQTSGFLSSEPVSSSSRATPPISCDQGPSSHHSTPSLRQTIHVLSPRQIFGPPRPPIVLPSSAKLPPSAIRLTPTTLPLFQNTTTSSSSISQTSSEDAPINLSKQRNESIDEETTNSQPTSISSDINATEDEDVPCVEVSQTTAYELPVNVIEDSLTSIQAGDSVNISYPVTDSNCQILIQDEVLLEDYLRKTGVEVVTLLAEDGPDGQITLVPQDEFREAETDQMNVEFDELKRNMAEIHVGEDNTKEEETNTEENSKIVHYYEKRVKDFQCVLDTHQTVNANYNNESARDSNQNEARPSTSTDSCSGIKKRKVQDCDTDSTETESEHLHSSKRRRSSRLNSCDLREEKGGTVTMENSSKKHIQASEKINSFSCGRCHSVLKSERSWRRHRDSLHGGSARLSGDPEGQNFDTDQEEVSWKAAMAACKKINCPRCSRGSFTKTSALIEHLKKCVRQPSNPSNKRKTGDKVKVNRKQELVPTEVPETGRSRRKAATKARSTVAEYVKAMKTKYEDESSEEEQRIEANVEDSDDNFNIDNVFNNFYKQVKIGKRQVAIARNEDWINISKRVKIIIFISLG